MNRQPRKVVVRDLVEEESSEKQVCLKRKTATKEAACPHDQMEIPQLVNPWKTTSNLQGSDPNVQQLDVSEFPVLRRKKFERRALEISYDNKVPEPKSGRKKQKKNVALQITYGLPLMHARQPAVNTVQSATVPELPATAPEVPVRAITEPTVNPEPELAAGHEPQPAEVLKPQPAAAPEPEPAAVEKHPILQLLHAKLTQNLQPAVQLGNTCAGSDHTQHGVLQISELQFHRILDEKDKKITTLEKEKAALLNEMARLHKQFQIQNSEAKEDFAVLSMEVHRKAQMHADASQKIEALEAALCTEKNKKKEVETSLVQQLEETSKLKTDLAQLERQLQDQRHQWEEERSRLLAEHQVATSSLKATIMQAQEDLENDRSKWNQEKSSLLQSITTMKEALNDKIVEREKSADELRDKLTALEQEMEIKSKKKKSLKTRFIQLFKRTGETPPPANL